MEIRAVDEVMGSQTDTDRYLERLKNLYPANPRYLLAILEDLQARFGYIAESLLPELCEFLHVSQSEVEQWLELDGVFRRRPPAGAHTLRICCGPVCAGHGGTQLFDRLGRRLGSMGAAIRLLASPCLGRCDTPPVAKLDEQCFAPADDEGLLCAVRELMDAGDGS